jgi:hypothetical protein
MHASCPLAISFVGTVTGALRMFEQEASSRQTVAIYCAIWQYYRHRLGPVALRIEPFQPNVKEAIPLLEVILQILHFAMACI